MLLLAAAAHHAAARAGATPIVLAPADLPADFTSSDRAAALRSTAAAVTLTLRGSLLKWQDYVHPEATTFAPQLPAALLVATA